MKRARIVAGVAAASVALIGCVSVLPKAAPVQLYRFGAADGAGTALVAPAPGAPVVSLGGVVLPRAAAGDGLLTVTGDEAAYVAGARWVSPAVVLMREAAVRAFMRRPGVRLVGADAPAPLRLDLVVTDFDTVYPTAGAAPSVRLVLTATLTSRAGAAVNRVVSVVRPVSENRLRAIVPTYDMVVDDALGQVAAWTEREAVLRPPQPLAAP
ncbi:MAG: membrane integrity-associated transporter subunit PqiC [Caulobacteraceae bacterium]|nr:membrane integrity-associated transporter subunit PqiC [Caulobacter sp.]